MACIVLLLLTLAISESVTCIEASVRAIQNEDIDILRESSLIIKAVEELYIKGLETRNFDLIETVCIPEARTMSTGRDGRLHITTLEKWSKRFDPKNPPFKKLDYTIVNIDREETIAQVKILFVVDARRLQMIKIDGQWRIVNIINT